MAQTLIHRDLIDEKQKHLLKLKTEVKQCKKCEDLVKTRNQSVPGYGDFYAQVLFVGEAPGRLGADVSGVPFTRDRSGVFLQKMLCKIGVNQSKPESESPNLKGAYITNIVRCNPRKSDGTNRTPSNEEIKNCIGHLSKEIEIIKPRIIVTLGLPASKVILGEKFNGKDFGKMKKVHDYYVLPLWHPAFVIRGGGTQRMNEIKYTKYFIKIKEFLSMTD